MAQWFQLQSPNQFMSVMKSARTFQNANISPMTLELKIAFGKEELTLTSKLVLSKL